MINHGRGKQHTKPGGRPTVTEIVLLSSVLRDEVHHVVLGYELWMLVYELCSVN